MLLNIIPIFIFIFPIMSSSNDGVHARAQHERPIIQYMVESISISVLIMPDNMYIHALRASYIIQTFPLANIIHFFLLCDFCEMVMLAVSLPSYHILTIAQIVLI